MSLTASTSPYNQVGPTLDDGTAGRWVACDESGWDGEQLMNGGPYFVYAAVAVDDSEAELIVERLRAETGAKAPELKFKDFKGRPGRRDALRRLWAEDGALQGRCWAFVFEKEYAAVAKVIDLLLEEQAFAAGIDLHVAHQAAALAQTLRQHGRRALGDDRFEQLMAAFIAFASVRGRGDNQARENFFDHVEKAWASSTRRNVSDILMALRATRLQAMTLHDAEGPDAMLELIVSSVGQAARWWGGKLGPVSVLTDEQTALSDDALANIAQVVRKGWGPTPSSRQPSVDLRTLVRGSSAKHPSIQLADLLAGAVRVCFEHQAGTAPSDAGRDLWPSVLPLLDPNSAAPGV